MKIKPYTVSASICLACALIAVGFGVAKKQSSINNQSARMSALQDINNYRDADNCWNVKLDYPLMIGTVINTPPGQIPTACFYHQPSGLYGYAAYLNGKLQVIRVFTQTEVDRGVPHDKP